MIVFDASGSMGTTDYALKVPRIARVKRSLAHVVPEVAPVRRLGLIVYGEGAYDDCKSIRLHMRPTIDAAEQLLGIVDQINPRGRTPLTESVRQAAEVLNYTEQQAVVVLVTDGEETCGGDPCAMGAQLERKGRDITVHVIGYREGESDYFKARCIADATGGKYYAVSTEDQLIEALRKTLGCPFLTQQRDLHFAAKAQLPHCENRCSR
jgi:Ca-activated chloride channel family protein